MEQQKQPVTFSEIQRYVQECKYPCSKEELISCAREHQAPSEIIRTLQVIGPAGQFQSLEDVRHGVERSF